ncbi:YihY/virulence factor BrkB family protein [soil metagenome]
MKEFFKNSWHIIKDSFYDFRKNDPVIYSGSIAFFTIFSLPAILIVFTLVGSLFFTEEDVRDEIVAQVESIATEEAATQVGTILKNIVELPARGWGIIIGVLVVINSATAIFHILQKGLNSIWDVKVKDEVKYLKLIKYRLKNFAMVAGLGLLFFLTILFDTLLVFFDDQLRDLFGGMASPAIWILNYLFSMAVVLIFFSAILKVLPDTKIAWKDAFAGGIITAILFLLGKQLINFIIQNILLAGLYAAAAGSLVFILLWVFYSSIILFLGAEITKAYANNRGREIKPTEISEKMEIVKK